jgi:hypothetical protein
MAARALRTQIKIESTKTAQMTTIVVRGTLILLTATLATTTQALADNELRDDFQDFSINERIDEPITERFFDEAAPKPFKLTFGIDAIYNSNILARRANEVDDWTTAPTLGLEWKREWKGVTAKLAAGLSSLRAHDFSNPADNDKADVSARITLTALKDDLDGFTPFINYRWRGTYRPFFDTQSQSFKDATFGVSKKWEEKGAPDSYTLTMDITDRSADPVTGNRDQAAAKLDYVYKFAKTWRLSVTPRVSYTWYSDGANDGREDMTIDGRVVLETETGIPSLTVGVAASIGETFSNRPNSDHVTQFSIGPSINYAYEFDF